MLEVSNSVTADSAAGESTVDAGPPGDPHVGLSIVAAVLEAHGATIEWQRLPGSITARVELAAPARDELELAGGVARLGGST